MKWHLTAWIHGGWCLADYSAPCRFCRGPWRQSISYLLPITTQLGDNPSPMTARGSVSRPPSINYRDDYSTVGVETTCAVQRCADYHELGADWDWPPSALVGIDAACWLFSVDSPSIGIFWLGLSWLRHILSYPKHLMNAQGGISCSWNCQNKTKQNLQQSQLESWNKSRDIPRNPGKSYRNLQESF